MSEKLFKCHCIVPGHGTKCVVAHEIKREHTKKVRNKKRRKTDHERMADAYEDIAREVLNGR